jgi:hypothetical protein
MDLKAYMMDGPVFRVEQAAVPADDPGLVEGLVWLSARRETEALEKAE